MKIFVFISMITGKIHSALFIQLNTEICSGKYIRQMNKGNNMKNKLSINERYLLTYVKYKTNNGHTFFMGNEAIGEIIGCKTSSTKVMVNKLIRNGYLLKTQDKHGRRVLSLSDKTFKALDGVNLSNVEKSLLKQDAKDQEQWAAYYKKEYENALSRIEYLENEVRQLRDTLDEERYKKTRITAKEPDPIVKIEEKPQQIKCSESTSSIDPERDPAILIANIMAQFKDAPSFTL